MNQICTVSLRTGRVLTVGEIPFMKGLPMSFSGPIRLQMMGDGVNWILLEEVTYTDKAGRKWVAPAGMVTDLASIPRELWSLVGSPGTGRYRMAAVFHDAAYRTPGVSKADADRMLRECSIECGTSEELADIIYEGVRLGGTAAYAADQSSGEIPPT